MTGSGDVAIPTGDGTADLLVQSDNTHPTTLGNTNIAVRVLAAIRAAARQ